MTSSKDRLHFCLDKLGLHGAFFMPIDHEDAIVAQVYRIVGPTGSELILKLCACEKHYRREVYFLKYFAARFPVPPLLGVVPPDKTLELSGAVLMEKLPGSVLNSLDLSLSTAYELGALLATVHQERIPDGYGDVTLSSSLSLTPKSYFCDKFEEGLLECDAHLPQALLEQFRQYYRSHLNLLESVDGPCIVHRDFRPGNIIMEQGRVRGIIDWSSACAGFAEEDFCSIEHGWPLCSRTKPAFLAGYASIRSIPDYRYIMPLLRLSQAIAIVGFTLKRQTWNKSSLKLYENNRRFLDEFFITMT